MTLFDGSLEEWQAQHPVSSPSASATMRRTAARQALLNRGVHPTTHLPLLKPPGATCGGCTHLAVHRISRTYYKCDVVHMTNGPATDTRLSWPACTKYEAADGQ